MSAEQEQDEARDVLPDALQTGRATSSPGPGFRHRPLSRAATLAESAPRFSRRENSIASESLSDSRRSFKASTDDLFLPRATGEPETRESSNWHSIPLGLALLPAIGGLFFQNGSAFVTDLTLLGLAALFLNWALRLPWDWYHSAQAVVVRSEAQYFESVLDDGSSQEMSDVNVSPERSPDSAKSQRLWQAEKELRVHELLALLACFAFPALGAWLLHAIRSQLTRPSESLISDYNLTVFLLASEVRPLSHLIKLVQGRTLFLQRIITVTAEDKESETGSPGVDNMSKRLDELEARVANSVVLSTKSEPNGHSPTEDLTAKVTDQANAELRRTFQPEIDALSRAMRRYEKKTMTSAIQIEARLQELEGRVQDVVIIAAATQRNADKQAGKYTFILANWISACIVVPIQYAVYVLTWPQRVLTAVTHWIKRKLGFTVPPPKGQQGKSPTKLDLSRRKSNKERSKS
ncbi:hypothetical protein LTR64_007207 [Lithohypha guttulata]|uniref:uncharacterized protein n=1 Tax=Lithohypha guttulata TaxID=1690604 RepID=UPI002DDF5BB3|nr:hypothetical protein LTR51_004237 [Lithohypha guttulata]